MIHEMMLHPAPFEMIKSGTKIFELRLYDAKRQRIRETSETLRKTVVKSHHFHSFEALYQALPLLQCGYTSENLHTAHPSDMNQYHSLEEQGNTALWKLSF